MGRALAALGLVGAALWSWPAAAAELSSADKAAAFRAAGFKLEGGRWRGCDDPGTGGYMPGSIESVQDLNGDGRPEAVITESSTFCFGATESGYSLVSKQGNGSWQLMSQGPGVITFLSTKGVAGWPDMEIGGPGFCFPVHRWNGSSYALQRHEYEGKACRPAS